MRTLYRILKFSLYVTFGLFVLFVFFPLLFTPTLKTSIGKTITRDEAIALFIEKYGNELSSMYTTITSLGYGEREYEVVQYKSPKEWVSSGIDATVAWQFLGIDDLRESPIIRILPGLEDASLFSSIDNGVTIRTKRNRLGVEFWRVVEIKKVGDVELVKEMKTRNQGELTLLVISKNIFHGNEEYSYILVKLEKQ